MAHPSMSAKKSNKKQTVNKTNLMDSIFMEYKRPNRLMVSDGSQAQQKELQITIGQMQQSPMLSYLVIPALYAQQIAFLGVNNLAYYANAQSKVPLLVYPLNGRLDWPNIVMRMPTSIPMGCFLHAKQPVFPPLHAQLPLPVPAQLPLPVPASLAPPYSYAQVVSSPANTQGGQDGNNNSVQASTVLPNNQQRKPPTPPHQSPPLFDPAHDHLRPLSPQVAAEWIQSHEQKCKDGDVGRHHHGDNQRRDSASTGGGQCVDSGGYPVDSGLSAPDMSGDSGSHRGQSSHSGGNRYAVNGGDEFDVDPRDYGYNRDVQRDQGNDHHRDRRQDDQRGRGYDEYRDRGQDDYNGGMYGTHVQQRGPLLTRRERGIFRPEGFRMLQSVTRMPINFVKNIHTSFDTSIGRDMHFVLPEALYPNALGHDEADIRHMVNALTKQRAQVQTQNKLDCLLEPGLNFNFLLLKSPCWRFHKGSRIMGIQFDDAAVNLECISWMLQKLAEINPVIPKFLKRPQTPTVYFHEYIKTGKSYQVWYDFSFKFETVFGDESRAFLKNVLNVECATGEDAVFYFATPLLKDGSAAFKRYFKANEKRAQLRQQGKDQQDQQNDWQ